MLKQIQIKEMRKQNQANLDYIREECPHLFNQRRIDRNIEIILDATTEVLGVKPSDHDFVASIWEITTNIYLNNLVNEIKQKETWGLIIKEIQKVDEEQAYKSVLSYYEARGMI
ncbi:hypothetical protein CEE44_00095 [Candidatus Woesearchaeota archaeon B3_Woes]|nr:MAG: hypothetical protein CEE44_00095 [Candidatus Woesearchaeota archaeon B3_Woes]